MPSFTKIANIVSNFQIRKYVIYEFVNVKNITYFTLLHNCPRYVCATYRPSILRKNTHIV